VEVDAAIAPKERKATAKRKATMGTSTSKSMAVLEKKKEEALSLSPDDDEEGFLKFLPTSKR
jgi:hypothetical protein